MVKTDKIKAKLPQVKGAYYCDNCLYRSPAKGDCPICNRPLFKVKK